MTFNPGVNCCPCCKVPHCLNGDRIDDGCCVGCDDLIMWSERPSQSAVQESFTRVPEAPPPECPGYIKVEKDGLELDALLSPDGSTGGSVGKYFHYKTYTEELDPVQTLYSYYNSYWRPYGSTNYNIGIPGDFGERILPLLDDPINCDGFSNIETNEFYKTTDPEINTGLLARCRYDSQFDRGLAQMRKGDCQTLTRLRTCLHLESPCNGTNPVGKDGTVTSGCVGQETLQCYGESLTQNSIMQDLSRGYPEFSHISVKYGNSSFGYEEFWNCCYPSGSSPGSDPCGPPPSIRYPRCTCGSLWLTNYRKRKLMDDKRYIWAVDVECYYGGDFINPREPKSLSDYWLFNMSNERWWRIKETTGLDPDNPDRKIPLSFWDLPGANRGVYPNPTKGIPVTKDPNTGELVGGYCGYSDDKEVPKWWIYGCSSVPVFLFELEDALLPMCSAATDPLIRRDPVIENDDKTNILQYIRNQINPNPVVDLYYRSICQSAYERMSKGGYFDSKDWKEDQLQAYRELADRFPGQGYDAAVQNMLLNWDNIELGPFRKRYYASHTLSLRSPYLHPLRVANSCKDLQAPFYKDYPGKFPNQVPPEEREKAINDYYFWAERQWVYFRGAPQGWAWASWHACDFLPCSIGGCPSTEEGEIQAILAGCGRFGGDCIDSWFNQPQRTGTVNVGDGNFISTQYYISDCVGENNPCCSQPDLDNDGNVIDNGCQNVGKYVCDFKYPNGCKPPVCRGERTPRAECGGCDDTDPNCCVDAVGPCNWSDQDCEYRNYKGCCSCYRNWVKSLEKPISIPRCSVPENTIVCGVSPPNTEEFNWCGCQTALLQGCSDLASSCLTANFNSYCNGVHIIVTQYHYENFIERQTVEPPCNSDANCLLTPAYRDFGRAKYKRLYQSNTFLTSARNSYEYRQNRCLASSDRSLRGFWPTVKNSHKIFTSICEANIRANFYSQPKNSLTACSQCTGLNESQGHIISAPGSRQDCGFPDSTPRPTPAGTWVPVAGGPWPGTDDMQYSDMSEVAKDGAYCSPQILLLPCSYCRDPIAECNCWKHDVLGCMVRPECTFGGYSSSWIGRAECPPSCGGSIPNDINCERDDYLGYNIVCKGTP